ncbi:hypothetical protein BDK51DRAFT_50950 [Blyttiomyces helicus]|uniref:Uncharacterized protein n=1 Tax=Blyttiomyces helicus TaxID=388810 RepID=A0A4P9WM13_9FUNG|nr:hypothetical protein BDK51DRAFT_50950 [Blyttiomyces helicus]|eukprot:RKO93944.1 hypothetical protein BDK51DRAFT_50950 [Blyttiomyces helicus]
MSNIRLNAIVPDDDSGTISVTGPLEGTTLSISSTLEAASLSIASTTISGSVELSQVCLPWRVLSLSAPLDSLGAGSTALISQSLALTSTRDASSSIIRGGLTINIVTSLSTSTYSVEIHGGVTIAQNLFIFNGNVQLLGTISISNTNDTSSSSTGSLTNAGGLYDSKTLSVGGTVNFNCGLNISLVILVGDGVNAAVNLQGILTQSGSVSFLNTTMSISIASFYNTCDSSSLSTGNPVISGGIEMAKSIYVGGNIISTGATTTGTLSASGTASLLGTLDSSAVQLLTTTSTNAYIIMSRSNGTGTLRNLVPQSGSANTGQLTLNTNGCVSIVLSAIDTSSISSSSVVLSGGLGVNGSVSLAKNLNIFGLSTGSLWIIASSNVSSYTLVLPSSSPGMSVFALESDASVTITNTNSVLITTAGGMTGSGVVSATRRVIIGGHDFILGNANQWTNRNSGSSRVLVKDSGATLVIKFMGDFVGGVRIDSALTVNSTTVSSSSSSGCLVLLGDLGIAGGIFENMIVTQGSNGLSSPTLSTQSSGTRYVLLSAVSKNRVDFAIGLQPGYIWYSSSWSSSGHKWYSGTTNTMTLDGDGTLTISKTTENRAFIDKWEALTVRHYQSWSVTGVVTLNRNAVDMTGTVQLIENDNTQVSVLPGTTTYGAYRYLVTDVNRSGTSACFHICGNTSHGGSVIRSVCSLGSMGEHVMIT